MKLEEDIALSGAPARVFSIWRAVGQKEIIVQAKENPPLELRFDYLGPTEDGWRETVKSFALIK